MAGKRQAVADFSEWESQQKAKVCPIIQAGGLESGAPDQHRVQAGERQAEGVVETSLEMVAGGAKDPVTASDAFWKMIDAWPELAAIRRQRRQTARLGIALRSRQCSERQGWPSQLL